MSSELPNARDDITDFRLFECLFVGVAVRVVHGNEAHGRILRRDHLLSDRAPTLTVRIAQRPREGPLCYASRFCLGRPRNTEPSAPRRLSFCSGVRCSYQPVPFDKRSAASARVGARTSFRGSVRLTLSPLFVATFADFFMRRSSVRNISPLGRERQARIPRSGIAG